MKTYDKHQRTLRFDLLVLCAMTAIFLHARLPIIVVWVLNSDRAGIVWVASTQNDWLLHTHINYTIRAEKKRAVWKRWSVLYQITAQITVR